MARSKRRMCLCASAALLCLIILIILCAAIFATRTCPAGEFRHAAVAADTETCSKIGSDVLRRGGSAVDGAIAALLCTSIINPQSMGIGGGSIFTVRDKDGKVKVINSRETVPRGVRADLLQDCPKGFQRKSATQWIGVPGEIRGYEIAHQLYGRLPWAELFWPTIQLARQGFPMQPVLGRYMYFISRENETSPLRTLFSHQNKILQVGEMLRFERLADTLEMIATQGPDAFYTGKIAADLIQDVHEAGGVLSLQDLKSYKAKLVDAWNVSLGDYEMYFPPPPSGGAIVGFILNIMKGFNLNPSSARGDQLVQTYHRYVETYKFAIGQLRNIRDPNFISSQRAFQMTTEDFAARVRSLITGKAHNSSYYNISVSADYEGTTHVSVLDQDGTAVSVTSSINYIFGSKIYSPRTGVILNNQLSDFCNRADNISPGEQPPSSMSPAVLYSRSKQQLLVIGGSGGSMIPAGLSQAIIKHLWLGEDLKEAIAAPIVFVDSTKTLKFESNFNQAVVRMLEGLGQQVGSEDTFYNVVNAVLAEGGCISAMSDSRKCGQAAGF